MFGTAYSFDPDSGASTGSVVAQYSPADPGEILRPANALLKPPPMVAAREVAVFLPGYEKTRDDAVTSDSDWVICPDWRGVPLFKTATGQAFFLSRTQINITPADVDATELAPGKDDSWDGSAWMLDAKKQRERQVREATAEQSAGLATATAAIAPLQDAVDLGMATAAETASLTAWKQYRVLLNRITQQSGYPGAIDWPAAPAA